MKTATREVHVKDDIDADKGIDPRLPNWIRLIVGNRVPIQCKGGVIITGTVESCEEGLLLLRAVEVKGHVRCVSPEWLLLDRTSIAHIHPVCEVANKPKA